MSRFAAAPVALALCLPAPAADPPQVEIVAHRGASADAPENTVAALKLAWEQKADGSEFDVYLSKDGHLVVMHDKDTKRTAGVAKPVAGSTLAELRALDVGRWKGDRFAGEKVPTLADMLAAVPAGKKLFIEVKCGPEAVPELDRGLKAAGLEPARTPVVSFNAPVIAALKKARPDVPAYFLANLVAKKGTKPPTAEDLVAKAKEIGADGLDLSVSPDFDAEFVRKVRAAGLKLYVWTVNDPAVAKRVATLGVDGITTDKPGWLREQLAR